MIGYPKYAVDLAEELARRHGNVTLSTEDHGIHARCASPKCLDEYGAQELTKRNLYINLDKYARMGQFAGKRVKKGQEDSNEYCAWCMKSKTPYTMSELLAMKPLAQRGYKETTTKVIAAPPAYLIDDGHGNKIPDHPGRTVPLPLLPATHPVIQYLHSRGFSPKALWEWCKASYCEEAAPEGILVDDKGEEFSRYYRRMSGNTKDTPEGRLILPCYVDGVRGGWQARILDKVEGDLKYHWISAGGSPLSWVPTHKLIDKKWELLPGFDDTRFPFSPSKYRNASGSKRNEILMGYDAAVKWNEDNSSKIPFCFLCEGPLDAARIGAPAIALLGKFMGSTQADRIASKFRLVYIVPDNDAIGLEAVGKFITTLTDRNLRVVRADIPKHYAAKDAGDLTPQQAAEFRRNILYP